MLDEPQASPWNLWNGPNLSVDSKKVMVDVFLSEHKPLCSLGSTPLTRPSSFISLQKLFIGQLPPKASRENIAWLFIEWLGIPICWVEKIKQWSKGGRPTGCFHVYCEPEYADKMFAQVGKIYCSPDLQLFDALPGNIPSGWSRCFVTVEKAESVARHRQQSADTSGTTSPVPVAEDASFAVTAEPPAALTPIVKQPGTHKASKQQRNQASLTPPQPYLMNGIQDTPLQYVPMPYTPMPWMQPYATGMHAWTAVPQPHPSAGQAFYPMPVMPMMMVMVPQVMQA